MPAAVGLARTRGSLAPLRRNGNRADITKAVTFLLSGEAACIKASIVAYGGYTDVDYMKES